MGACVHEGLNIELVFVGSGGYQPQLEAQAVALGIGTRVQFCGQLVSADAVRAELDRADLFVLPSRQEGLPRAMIEAMARWPSVHRLDRRRGPRAPGRGGHGAAE